MFIQPDSMQALVLQETGDNFSLSPVSLPLPKVEEDQLLIEVEYAAINPVDTKLARRGNSEWQFPHIPLLDGVGKVVASGSGFSPLIGERVLWHNDLTRPGVLAEYAAIEAHAVAVLPDSIDAMAAASIPCPGMTAALSICTLSAQAGDNILIEAGSGAVGQFAIQLAKQTNLTVYTTAAKQHHAYLKSLGADYVFDYKSKNLVAEIKKQLGHTSFDAVLDAVGGETTVRDIELLKFNGAIACLTGLPDLDPELLFRKSPSIHMISLGGAWLSKDMCAQQKLGLKGNCLLDMVVNNQLQLPPIHEIPFSADAVTQAMHRQLDGGVFGKQVVNMKN